MDSSHLMTDQKKDGALTAQTRARKTRSSATRPREKSGLDRVMG